LPLIFGPKLQAKKPSEGSRWLTFVANGPEWRKPAIDYFGRMLALRDWFKIDKEVAGT